MPNGGFTPIFLRRKEKTMMEEQLRVVKELVARFGSAQHLVQSVARLEQVKPRFSGKWQNRPDPHADARNGPAHSASNHLA